MWYMPARFLFAHFAGCVPVEISTNPRPATPVSCGGVCRNTHIVQGHFLPSCISLESGCAAVTTHPYAEQIQ